MSINSVGSCSTGQVQASQYRSSGNASASASVRPPGDAGQFVSAIASALTELGAGSSTDSAAPAQALGQFLNTLMETLKPPGGRPDGPPPPPPGGGMQSGLQSLIDSTGDDDATSATSALEQSFASLLASLGLDSDEAGSKLGQFLQSLASKLEASGPSGNLINTTA
ncbi:MAG: hypothetical protein V4484_18500 [Pseudomonadota bacterium]